MPRREIIKWQTQASRVSSVVGIGFKFPEPDYDVMKRLLTYLEDRRALYVGAIWEQPDYVVQSILETRKALTDALGRLSNDNITRDLLRNMRDACHEFLKVPAPPKMNRDALESENFLIALGVLRATFGRCVATIAYDYQIDLDAKLGPILPPVRSD